MDRTLPRLAPHQPGTVAGAPQCTKPYSTSVINVSAMSFGALSGNAIRALNTAARRGGFAHVTGEGGFSVHHREPGGADERRDEVYPDLHGDAQAQRHERGTRLVQASKPGCEGSRTSRIA